MHISPWDRDKCRKYSAIEDYYYDSGNDSVEWETVQERRSGNNESSEHQGDKASPEETPSYSVLLTPVALHGANSALVEDETKNGSLVAYLMSPSRITTKRNVPGHLDARGHFTSMRIYQARVECSCGFGSTPLFYSSTSTPPFFSITAPFNRRSFFSGCWLVSYSSSETNR